MAKAGLPRCCSPPRVPPWSAVLILVGSTAGLTGSLTLMRSAHTAAQGGVIALARHLGLSGVTYFVGWSAWLFATGRRLKP